METLQPLFDNNRAWAEQLSAEQPGFFEQLSKGQSPDYLWIGCSDSRVSPELLLNLPPGGVFVHRNIANVVHPDDPGCLAVIQYAVEVLRVKHIIVCGHYGCGGVQASMEACEPGSIDSWLDHVRGVHAAHRKELDGVEDQEKKADRLCELNVMEQVAHVCGTEAVSGAWACGQKLLVHGWIYSLRDGLIKDLRISADGS